MPPWSDKTKRSTPASGSKHDYMSQAPYFWYDSSKPNGLPDVRRDGQGNPEINKLTDPHTLGDLGSHTQTLALAWYLTRDNRYAEKAAQLIRAWFLDDATRMNPNLEYGQGIPGINTGRGIGLIETRSLMPVVDAVGLLAGSKAWSAADQEGIKTWLRPTPKWEATSPQGPYEGAGK